MKVWERIKTLWHRAEWTVQGFQGYPRPGTDEQFEEWNTGSLLPPLPHTTVDKETGTFRFLCDCCELYFPQEEMSEVRALGGRYSMLCEQCVKERAVVEDVIDKLEKDGGE